MVEYLGLCVMCLVLFFLLMVFAAFMVKHQDLIERWFGIEVVELSDEDRDVIESVIRMRVEIFVTMRCMNEGSNIFSIPLKALWCESVNVDYLMNELDEMNLHELIELFDIENGYLIIELNSKLLEYAVAAKQSRMRMERRI